MEMRHRAESAIPLIIVGLTTLPYFIFNTWAPYHTDSAGFVLKAEKIASGQILTGWRWGVALVEDWEKRLESRGYTLQRYRQKQVRIGRIQAEAVEYLVLSPDGRAGRVGVVEFMGHVMEGVGQATIFRVVSGAPPGRSP